MKLLLDQNLSPRLMRRLADLYPNSIHVMEVGLDHSLDREVWDYARQNDYLIVTKDVDFSEFSILQGFPPKVIWVVPLLSVGRLTEVKSATNFTN